MNRDWSQRNASKVGIQVATMQIDTEALSGLLSSSLSGAGAVDALAALCLTLNLDPTLWPLTATTTGRVLTSMGRQAGLREAALTSGSIQTFTPTALTAVQAVPICIDSHLPEDMEGALSAVGVEPDAVATLYFDAAHGPMFRQRMKGKWRTFCDLVTRGLVANPTGFFISAIRKNWMLSSSYVPGLKKIIPDPAADLRAAKERDALAAQSALDALSMASPAEQWAAHASTLRFYLSWPAADLLRLERACCGGLSAAALAREGAAARLSGEVKAWAEGVRLRL